MAKIIDSGTETLENTNGNVKMEEIISYIMKTPENVNGNILREKLKDFQKSGGDDSNAYLVKSRGGLVQGVFSEAKECFLEGKPVLYVKCNTSRPVYGEFVRLETNVRNRDTGEIIPEALLEENSTSGTAFGSDGTVFGYGMNINV